MRRLEQLTLERDTVHSEVDCTYSIVTDDLGRRYLQVDTYGSTERQIPGEEEPVNNRSLRKQLRSLSDSSRKTFEKAALSRYSGIGDSMSKSAAR